MEQKFAWCILGVLVLVYSNKVNGATSCHSGWTRHGNSCYLFAKQEETWADAMQHCKAFGAHLVEIQTSEEDHFILDRLRNVIRSGKDYWGGATDIASIGTWEWVQGRTLVTYSNWAPGEPSTEGSPNCLQFWVEKLYLWDNTWCLVHKPFICEEELEAEIIG